MQSIETKKKYCGPEDLGNSEKITITIPKVDGKYGTQNLLCRYTFTNLKEKNEIILSTQLSVMNLGRGFSIYFFVKFTDSTTAVRNIDKEQYKVTIDQARTIDIYVGFTDILDNSPFTITIESEEPTINLTLIITIVLIIVACIICSVSIYLFSKRLARKRELQNQLNREIATVGTIQVYPIVNGNSQRNLVNTEELIKQKRKEQLGQVLKNVIKPTKYSDDIGKYNMNCTICLEEFRIDSIVGITQCHHVFHYQCLKTWLHQNLLNPKCPNCNSHILPECNINPAEQAPINNEPQRIQFQSQGGNIMVSPSHRNNFVPAHGSNVNFSNA